MPRLNIELFKSKTYKNGEHPIMLRLSHNSRHKYIYTGHSVMATGWNTEKNLPTSPKLKNAILNKFTAAENVLYELDRSGKTYTIDHIVKRIKADSTHSSFIKYGEKMVEGLKKAKRLGTADSYNTTLNVIKTHIGNKDLDFSDINHSWLKKFEEWHLSKGNTVGGIGVYMRAIRAIYNSAIRDGNAKQEAYPFGTNGYQIPSQAVKHRAISKEQINAIRDLDLPKNSSIWTTRNLFLFSFYCRGMNWKDMAELTPNHIQDGRIVYIRSKTRRKRAKTFSIKITKQIQEILDIYQLEKKTDDYLFPIIKRKSLDDKRKDLKNGLKTYNKHMRKIASLAGIEGNITSYVARHSWGTIAKRAGIDLNVISDGYGHADSNVTRVYLDSIENDDIDNANDLISNL